MSTLLSNWNPERNCHSRSNRKTNKAIIVGEEVSFKLYYLYCKKQSNDINDAQQS